MKKDGESCIHFSNDAFYCKCKRYMHVVNTKTFKNLTITEYKGQMKKIELSYCRKAEFHCYHVS